jgi:coproporphyrinogen III oxidase-like Fe-S oxidoreductase
VRWGNALHPTRWAAALREGRSPAAGRETPGVDAARLEHVMLAVRLAEGLELDRLPARARGAAAQAAADGLVEPAPLAEGRAVLTLRGRLLADHVTLTLAE